MSYAGDKFPEAFQIEHLLEPSTATIAAFQASCIELDLASVVLASWQDEEAYEQSGQHVCYSISERFNNGSQINGSSAHGTDEWLAAYGEVMPLRSIHIRTADGTEYDYKEELQTGAKLWIKKPGDRVLREEAPFDGINLDGGNGVSLSMHGTPEFMQVMARSIAERREARRLGLDKPMDSAMKEFTGAIKAALASGKVPKLDPNLAPYSDTES
jgi:hypothetical protein